MLGRGRNETFEGAPAPDTRPAVAVEDQIPALLAIHGALPISDHEKPEVLMPAYRPYHPCHGPIHDGRRRHLATIHRIGESGRRRSGQRERRARRNARRRR